LTLLAIVEPELKFIKVALQVLYLILDTAITAPRIV
jgi:hypothetical protein